MPFRADVSLPTPAWLHISDRDMTLIERQMIQTAMQAMVNSAILLNLSSQNLQDRSIGEVIFTKFNCLSIKSDTLFFFVHQLLNHY